MYQTDLSPRAPRASRFSASLTRPCSERLQVLDQVLFLLAAQAEPEEVVVVFDHVGKRREAAVVVETTLLVRPEASKRRSAVAPVGGAVGLEIVDADFLRRVQVPAGLRKDRRDVALRAPACPAEDDTPTFGRRRVIT